MVLCLKARESRSPPDPHIANERNIPSNDHQRRTTQRHDAGWSSPVARQAHNLKVTGSNPVPATNISLDIKDFKAEHNARLLSFAVYINATSTRHQMTCPPVVPRS